MQPPLLSLNSISVRSAKKTLLDSISFELRASEMLFILGNNGAGKSSLLKAILGIVSSSGDIKISGRNINLLSRREIASLIGYVPQGAELSVPYSVRQFVELSQFSLNLSRKERVTNASNAILLAGCELFADRLLRELSGGERQRVLIAGALAQKPKILLIDEPTTYLDPRHQFQLAALFDKLTSQLQIAIIAVTHDINFVLGKSARYIALKQGKCVGIDSTMALIQGGALEAIYEQPFTIHTFGNSSFAAASK